MSLMENSTKLDHGTIFYPENAPRNLVVVFFVTSSIGIALSACAFILLVLTAVRFPEWRQSYKNQLLIQFMFARILYTFVRYVYDIRNFFELCNRDCVIILDKFLMTYTEVVLIAWMYMFTKHMHDSLVKVFNVEERTIWKLSLWTWFIPGLLSLILSLSYYFQKDKDIIFYLIYLLLVKWPFLSFIAVLLISILRSVLNSNQSTENNLKITIVMVVLVIVFSIHQFIIDITKLIYIVLLNNYVHYIFGIGSIVLLYHCAFSIIFWVFGNANTRKLWSNNKERPLSQIILHRNSSLQSY
ncbi:uncharacterized protein LOC132901939 [Amyelois transitella]|uniref:uncharacterized protein LOC132901939 n=1 Tax=Amyelois transitella TaxID=680683 RepID=UPI002990800F|nr:uncharacterized protein LOC132901939 [Amyelois transitella]